MYKKILFIFVIFLTTFSLVHAQNGIITTFAGNGECCLSGDGGIATLAQIGNPKNVALDTAGNMYIADTANQRIRKIDMNSVITTFAGNSTVLNRGYGGDGGIATEALFNFPTGVAVDNNGNVYIADQSNHRIRKVDMGGIITTVVGTGIAGYSGDDGLATNAQLSSPFDVTVDINNNLYIADLGNSRIRKVDINGIITTMAGDGIRAYGGDNGPATQAQLQAPKGVAVDGTGNVYIADTTNHRIRKVGTNGVITTIAGTGLDGFSGDGGLATDAQLHTPYDIIVDNNGNVFVSDQGNGRLRKIDTNGVITTYAGTGIRGYNGDNIPATQAQLSIPSGINIDRNNNVYVADSANHRIRKIDSNGIITTVAGTGFSQYNGESIPALQAQLTGSFDITFDDVGNLYFAESSNHRIRKIDRDGIITTFAGTGFPGFSGDGGLATGAQINSPSGVAFDSNNILYIADFGNRRLRKVDTNGIITTIAGIGTNGYNGDDIPAVQAQLNNILDVAIGPSNTLYLVDQGNRRIRKIDSNGIITTVAGNGMFGFSGDGGLATDAQLNFPHAVTVDNLGNIYVTDRSNQRIRKITVTGIITTVAGTGVAGFSGDGGLATDAQLNSPFSIISDIVGNLYIGDLGNRRLRKVTYAFDSDGDGIIDNEDLCPSENATGLDANEDGCKDTIDSLINVTQSINLDRGLENSLDTKLQAAQEALTANNANLREDAINKLQAYINQVEAQRGNSITNEQADLLIAMANNIIAQLS